MHEAQYGVYQKHYRLEFAVVQKQHDHSYSSVNEKYRLELFNFATCAFVDFRAQHGHVIDKHCFRFIRVIHNDKRGAY